MPQACLLRPAWGLPRRPAGAPDDAVTLYKHERWIHAWLHLVRDSSPCQALCSNTLDIPAADPVASMHESRAAASSCLYNVCIITITLTLINVLYCTSLPRLHPSL